MNSKPVKHIEINGVSFCLIPIVPFEEWVESRFGSTSKFDSLSKKDKERVFLRWKWGFVDERTNQELEFSEISFLHKYKDVDVGQLSNAYKFMIENKKRFAQICFETKKRIGLVNQLNPLVDKLIDIFDAEKF